MERKFPFINAIWKLIQATNYPLNFSNGQTRDGDSQLMLLDLSTLATDNNEETTTFVTHTRQETSATTVPEIPFTTNPTGNITTKRMFPESSSPWVFLGATTTTSLEKSVLRMSLKTTAVTRKTTTSPKSKSLETTTATKNMLTSPESSSSTSLEMAATRNMLTSPEPLSSKSLETTTATRKKLTSPEPSSSKSLEKTTATKNMLTSPEPSSSKSLETTTATRNMLTSPEPSSSKSLEITTATRNTSTSPESSSSKSLESSEILFAPVSEERITSIESSQETTAAMTTTEGVSTTKPTAIQAADPMASSNLLHSGTLPPNLQVLSLVFANSSSSLFPLVHDTSPPPHSPQQLENELPNHILPFIPHLSPSVPRSPLPSLLPDDEAEVEAKEKKEDKAPSSTPWSPVIEKFSLTHNAASIVNITGEVGGSVFMPCATHHSMEKQVSWVRRRDWHILTSGELTYTKEERFSVHHPEGSTDWTLVIKFLQLDDAGTYECQVSTGTGILSRLVDLEVVVPKAVIPGNGEYHIDAGSTITLDCYVHQTLVAPEYIFWYHNSRMINYDKERGGVQVHLEAGPQVRSRLTLDRATPADSGNYTCSAANSQPAYTTVYITNGNKIAAAIQPRVGGGVSRVSSYLATVFTLVLSVSLLPPLILLFY